MTSYGATELADGFRTVRQNTIAIAEDIREVDYSFKTAPGMITVAETLAHVATIYLWQVEIHRGRVLDISDAMIAAYRRHGALAQAGWKTKAHILRALHDNGERLTALFEAMSEEALEESVNYSTDGTAHFEDSRRDGTPY